MQQINTTISGQEVLIVLPDDYSAARTYYLIEFCHGMGADEQSLLFRPDILNAMLPMGYLFCASHAHGDNWGNDAALADYAALESYMRANYSISHLAMWGGSMGGPSALVHAATSPISAVKGACLIYPVCNLGAMYNDLDWADDSINIAYNIPGGGSYATQTAGHDPMLRATSEYAGKRFRFTHSPDDTFVPKATNSDAFAAKVTSVAAEMTVLPISGEHGAEDGLVVADVVAFYERCCRVLDSITLSTSVTAQAPSLVRQAVLEISSIAVNVGLYAPAVAEGRFIAPALSVAVEAQTPAMQSARVPVAHHARQMAFRRNA